MIRLSKFYFRSWFFKLISDEINYLITKNIKISKAAGHIKFKSDKDYSSGVDGKGL